MRFRLGLSLLVFLPAVAVAADEDPPPIKVVELPARKDPVAYGKDVEPVFIAKCSECHNNLKHEGNLDLSSYETLIKGGKRGSPLVAGNSANSLLIKSCGKTEKPFMPPRKKEPLSPEELA